jgi:hypothetical protein
MFRWTVIISADVIELLRYKDFYLWDTTPCSPPKSTDDSEENFASIFDHEDGATYSSEM